MPAYNPATDYFSYDALTAELPPDWVRRGLDDDGDGGADSFSKVREQGSRAVDALIATRYTVPLAGESITLTIQRAAVLSAVEIIYRRRGSHDLFPAREELADLRRILASIGKGERPLLPPAPVAPTDPPPVGGGASVIVRPALTGGSTATFV